MSPLTIMSPADPNVAASVRARLLNVAKAHGVDFTQVLVRFALERRGPAGPKSTVLYLEFVGKFRTRSKVGDVRHKRPSLWPARHQSPDQTPRYAGLPRRCGCTGAPRPGAPTCRWHDGGLRHARQRAQCRTRQRRHTGRAVDTSTSPADSASTCFVTLPSRKSSTMPAPCLPITIRSQSASCSCSTIASEGSCMIRQGCH